MDADPRHLNPLAAPTEWTLRVTMDTVFETLVRYEPPADGAGTGPGRYTPGLAASWRVTGGGKLIRIELRDGVTFHDGHKLSSVDVQFSIDAARSSRVDARHLRRQLADVTGVELAGPRALRIRLARRNGYVLRALAEIPILPEHVYRKRLKPRRGPVVGTGPYRLAVWDDDRIRLERYEQYGGESVSIDALEFVRGRDAARALTAAKRGEIDIVPALIPEHYPAQAEALAIQESFVPLRLRPPVLRYVAMGQSAPPLDDVRVRGAVARLIDREVLIDEAYGGLARVAGGPVWPGGPGDSVELPPPSHDPKAAAALLDASGWSIAAGSVARRRDGERLHVALLAQPGGDGGERARVVASLKAAGFFVEVRRGNAAVLMNRMKAAQFDLALVEWRSGVDTDLSPLLARGGKLNFGRFADDRVDAVLERLRAADLPATRGEIMPELARLIAELQPIAAISRPDPYGLVHRRVRGLTVWNGWIVLRRLSLAHEDE